MRELFNTLFNISYANGGLTTPKIEHQEVYDALEYGKMPEIRTRGLEQRKQDKLNNYFQKPQLVIYSLEGVFFCLYKLLYELSYIHYLSCVFPNYKDSKHC